MRKSDPEEILVMLEYEPGHECRETHKGDSVLHKVKWTILLKNTLIIYINR